MLQGPEGGRLHGVRSVWNYLYKTCFFSRSALVGNTEDIWASLAGVSTVKKPTTQ